MGECRLELPILMLPNACGTLDIQAGRLCRTGGNNSVVECDLAKVEVAGSNPVSRSSFLLKFLVSLCCFCSSAPSPSGKAEVCKTSIPGSNPGGASIFSEGCYPFTVEVGYLSFLGPEHQQEFHTDRYCLRDTHIQTVVHRCVAMASLRYKERYRPVSYTHLRAHET